MEEYRTVVLLLRNPKNRITSGQIDFSSKEVRFKSLAKLYRTYKTKQIKNKKFQMGYSCFCHSHLHLVGCKTNSQRKMVLNNLQKPFDIINHKILLKKMYFVGISATQLLVFLVWFVPLFTSLQISKKIKLLQIVAQQSTGLSLLGKSPH